MTAREIAGLFEQLELHLIGSLKRNLLRHKRQEREEGGVGDVPENWEAWQSAKLRDLRRFRRENQDILGETAPVIEAETEKAIQEQYAEGGADGFFGTSDERLRALIHQMQRREVRAEKAALRYMDDVYRRTILRTATAMTAGGMTLQKAVDEATRDFLDQGIRCIRYADGRQVDIASYVEMALRTCGTRAMLMGEAQQRQRMGIDTVLVSQYGACSDTCLPWQGRPYIDDVFQPYHGPRGGSFGVSRNGRQYMLLSVAIEGGLFHPNCRHTVTTWIEGVSTMPPPMDAAKIERVNKLEQKQRQLERQVRQAKREAAGLADPEAAKAARAEVRRRQAVLREFTQEHGDVLRRDHWRERGPVDGEKTGSALDPAGTAGYNNSRDREQYERYRSVLKDKVPDTLSGFQRMKREDAPMWDTLKRQYRVVNQYKADLGEFTVDEILEMDDRLISEKRENFTSKFRRSGNIAGAYVDGDYYLAHSKVDAPEELRAYKGKARMVTLRSKRTFRYIDVPCKDGTLRTDTFHDTEAKLFEEFAAMYEERPFKTITMISERGMCDSCKGVLEQFRARFPEVTVRVISHKKVQGDVWKYRRK